MNHGEIKFSIMCHEKSIGDLQPNPTDEKHTISTFVDQSGLWPVQLHQVLNENASTVSGVKYYLLKFMNKLQEVTGECGRRGFTNIFVTPSQ